MYRYNPYVKEIMQKVRAGELGEIYSIEAQMDCIQKHERRQWLSNFKGGMMFYLGCHLVDLILQIKGQPKRIIPLNKCTGKNVTEPAKDFGMAIFEYENGVSTAKTSAVEVGGYARRQLVVAGTLGTVELEPFEMYVTKGKGIYTGKTEYKEKAWNNLGEHAQTELFNRYHAMIDAFAQYVRGEKENPYTLDYELELYKTVLKCCQ
jgi:predicted dehydrogenase